MKSVGIRCFFVKFTLNSAHNARETARNAGVIIQMIGKSTEIKNPEDMKAEPKKFAFDYSYWSHDEYQERADGYLEASGSKYADQVRTIFFTYFYFLSYFFLV